MLPQWNSAVEPCRLIVDPLPGSGEWNMAVDEALLESAVAGRACTTRWYRWNQATLSIGYFQRPEEAHCDRRFAGLPVVRRLTGGGAIVHHHELTYSCTLPAWHPLATNVRDLYSAVHETIIRVLAGFRFDAGLRGIADAHRRAEFLCFGRGDDFDVVMSGRKVVGSAQRRRKGAVLQHGSLLLRRSEWASEFPGVFDCAGHAVPEADLVEQLSRAVSEVLSPKTARESLSKDEQRRAAQLMRGK
jgi:lipoate-protein ligase A